MCCDDVETVTTTTTTVAPGSRFNTVGNLNRQFGDGDKPQALVIHPVDQQKIVTVSWIFQ